MKCALPTRWSTALDQPVSNLAVAAELPWIWIPRTSSPDHLFLQAKEASPSVLETYGARPCLFERLPQVDQGRQGYRVWAGQRILQAHSDRFLGWIGSWYDERDGFPPTDFFFRQFRDMKGSLETSGLTASEPSKTPCAPGASRLSTASDLNHAPRPSTTKQAPTGTMDGG